METEKMPRTENKMGVMPVGKLLFSMSLPIMISMLVQALYNVVDSMFVARVSENALTALSMAFPIQNLMIAVSTGTGVGINALLSRSLGARDYESANRAATNGLFVMILSSIPFILFGLFGANAFMRAQTDIAEIVEYGTEYLRVVCMLSVGIFGQIAFERLLQSTGRATLSMFTQGIGAILNIVLDPILIFGWLGLPKMGVTGAAVATVIGQFASFGVGILFNRFKNPEIKLQLRGFRPSGAIIGKIYSVGVPSIIMASISSVMTFGMNKILIAFSSTAAAVFGVYFKLQSFVFMPVFGMNNGIVPIISYNYGAKKKKRILGTIKLAVLFAVCIMAAGTILFQCFPRQLLSLFSASEHMMSMGVPALRIISTSFLFAGVCIVLGSVFQALGRGSYSMLVSIARQLLVLVPVAYLLARSGDLNLIWWSYPIAEVVSLTVTLLLFARIYRQIIAKIPEGAE